MQHVQYYFDITSSSHWPDFDCDRAFRWSISQDHRYWNAPAEFSSKRQSWNLGWNRWCWYSIGFNIIYRSWKQLCCTGDRYRSCYAIGRVKDLQRRFECFCWYWLPCRWIHKPLIHPGRGPVGGLHEQRYCPMKLTDGERLVKLETQVEY